MKVKDGAVVGVAARAMASVIDVTSPVPSSRTRAAERTIRLNPGCIVNI